MSKSNKMVAALDAVRAMAALVEAVSEEDPSKITITRDHYSSLYEDRVDKEFAVVIPEDRSIHYNYVDTAVCLTREERRNLVQEISSRPAQVFVEIGHHPEINSQDDSDLWQTAVVEFQYTPALRVSIPPDLGKEDVVNRLRQILEWVSKDWETMSAQGKAFEETVSGAMARDIFVSQIPF